MKNKTPLELSKLNFSNIMFTGENILKDVSKEKIAKILEDYYSEKTTTAVLKKYGIDIRARDFSQNLPLIDSQIKCPFDGKSMYAQLPSKTRMKDWNPDIICIECSHTIFHESMFDTGDRNQCPCKNCINKLEKQAKTICKAIRTFNERIAKIPYVSLTLEDILNLALVLQGFKSNTLDNIGIFDRKENLDFGVNVLSDLAKKNILLISEQSPFDSIAELEDDGNFSYYPSKVNWRVNVETSFDYLSPSDLIQLLKNPNKGLNFSFDSLDINNIYLKCIHSELQSLFQVEFNELSLNFSKDQSKDITKINDMIDRLLINWSPSQIYGFIWQSVRKADNSRTRKVWGNYKYHQVDYVIKLIDELIINKSISENSNRKYRYPTKVTPYLKSLIFFNEILVEPDWFHKKVPVEITNSLQNVSYPTIERISKNHISDTTLVPEYVDRTVWYKISEFGIIIFDGNLEWLISNESAVYSKYKSSNEKWLIAAKKDYYIEGFYSFNFLLCLQDSLKISGKETFN